MRVAAFGRVCGSSVFSLDNYRWAIATIWSRFVTIKLNGMCDTAMLTVSTVRQLGVVRVASSFVCSVTVPTCVDGRSHLCRHGGQGHGTIV